MVRGTVGGHCYTLFPLQPRRHHHQHHHNGFPDGMCVVYEWWLNMFKTMGGVVLQHARI